MRLSMNRVLIRTIEFRFFVTQAIIKSRSQRTKRNKKQEQQQQQQRQKTTTTQKKKLNIHTYNRYTANVLI